MTLRLPRRWAVGGAIALLLAGGLLGRCSVPGPQPDAAAAHWRAVAEIRMKQVARLTVQRDSAIAAAARADTAVTRTVATLWEPAKDAVLADTALARDPAVLKLVAAGDSLKRASEDLQAKHRVAIALAKAVSDSLGGVIEAKDEELASHRRIRQPRIEGSASALWDIDSKSPVVRGDVGIRIRENTLLVAGLEQRFMPGETSRLVGLRWRFR